MASPGLESFCCAQNLSHHYVVTHSKYFNFQTNAYNGICIVSSACSIIGAIFLMIPWSSIRSHLAGTEGVHILAAHHATRGYQKRIIVWLSMADLMACLGILVRASVWISHEYPMSDIPKTADVDFPHIFCAISTAWIQYFYTCTYMWTFIYALEVVCRVNYKMTSKRLYHAMGWGIPLVLTVGGMMPLYLPSILQCHYDVGSLLPGFLSITVPMFLVMIINPILYLYASAAVKNVVSSSRGQYTDTERLLVLRIREKYFLIMLVFYVCWLPNVLNCILIFFRGSVSLDVFIGVWNAMAVSNPLQAFLNVLAYKTFSQANFGRARLTVNYIWRAIKRRICCTEPEYPELVPSTGL